MCGIAGIFGQLHGAANLRVKTLEAMTHALKRRGPDGEDHFFDHEAGVALGHRRLAIVDLSDAGAQPMTSHSGRYVIAYNGELYNTPELRAFMEARQKYAWRGHSDTEVLLELIEEVGIEAALARVDGMFAFALYDRKDRNLTLARDPFGEKPLYYGLVGDALVFASQMNAIRLVDGFTPVMDQTALAHYFKYSYIPAPFSIFEGINKLKPAHFVSINLDELTGPDALQQQPYWDPISAARTAKAAAFQGSYDDAKGAVEGALLKSVSGRMVSDVPLGCLLSGGIDSSLVSALMAQAGAAKPKTFCIGMAQDGFDESDHARQVAQHLGTDHTELILTSKDVLEVVPKVPKIYDEPFSDSSQIPTYLVSKLARQDVTVAMTGDAGDEVFGGYNRYFHGPRVWEKLQKLPMPVQRMMRGVLDHVPMQSVEAVIGMLGRVTKGSELGSGRASEKIKKFSGLLGSGSEQVFHDRLLTTGADVGRVLQFDDQIPMLSEARNEVMDGFTLMQRMMLNDTLNYLPGDILAKIDRASMYASLETRTPFLNREVYGLAWSLSDEMKVSGGVGKRILRDILYDHVPRDLVDRPKAGFAVPIGNWLRGELREWAEAGLSKSALDQSGVLDSAAVQARWQEHLSGRRNHDTFLWSVLMFQGWHDEALG